MRLQVSNTAILLVNAERFFNRRPNDATNEILERIAKRLSIVIRFANDTSYSIDRVGGLLKEVLEALQDRERPKILLSGVDLEEAISLAALQALEYGFEVFLLADLIEPFDNVTSHYSWQRLVQAGAIPTTFSQAVLELISSVSDEQCANEVRLLLSTFKSRDRVLFAPR